MASLKVNQIQDDKEAWENIPPIITNSISALSDNFKFVKQWAVKNEKAEKEEKQRRLELEEKVKQTNQRLEAAQERLKFLFAYANSLYAHQRRDCRTITACVQRHLGATRSHFKCMGSAFGVDKIVDTNEVANHELGDLQVLVSECGMLDAQLQMLDEAFLNWENSRNAQSGKINTLEEAAKELRLEGERTHERLCSWRETIRENGFAVKSLNDMLAKAQDEVDDLRDTKVSHNDLSEALGEKHKELLDAISKEMLNRAAVTDKLDLRCDDLYSKLDMHVHETDQRMDKHNADVMGIMESTLNPVTAYLNSMHVKADDVKAKLNVIQKQVPVLETGLDEARNFIKQLEEYDHNQFLLHNGRIEGLEGCVEKHNEQFREERAFFFSSIQNSKNEVNARVDEVNDRFKQSYDVQEDQANRVVNLEDSLSQLQQKVAKWVHTQPLPVKVSEARIFALEARINEEIDRRLQLEARVETPALTATPAYSRPPTSQGVAPGLPKLSKTAGPPSHRRSPSTDDGRPISSRG